MKICDDWSGKDDDNVPEYGNTYAKLKDGTEKIYNSDNWDEFVKEDDAKNILEKSCVGVMSIAQIDKARRTLGKIEETFDDPNDVGDRVVPMTDEELEEHNSY